MNILLSHPTLAFGIPSGPDMFIIAVVVLVLFGAKKLPLFARSLGRSMGEFKRAREEFETELTRAADDTLPPPRPRAPEPKPAEQPQQPVTQAAVTTTQS